jgi:cell division protein FtsB
VRSRDITRRFFSRPIGRSPFAPPPIRIPRWAFVVGVLYLAYALVFSESSLWHIAQLKREIAMAEADTRHITEETARLEAKVKDPVERRFHAEEVARTQQGWAAPGELVYRFQDGKVKADSTR